jgi:hypothetical protein
MSPSGTKTLDDDGAGALGPGAADLVVNRAGAAMQAG